MKKHFSVLVLTLAFATIFLLTQNNKIAYASTNYSQTAIIVLGEAEVKAIPDTAVVSFSIETINENLADAEQQSKESVDKVINSLSEFGIEKSNIKTDGFYAYKKHTYEERIEKFVGYSVQNSISVQITNLDNVQNIVSAIAANGATSFNNVNYYKQDTSSLYNTALENALERAREKALLLTESENVYLVKVIEENMSHFHTYKMAATSLQESLYSGEILVSAKVKALFSTTKPTENAPTPSIYQNKINTPQPFKQSNLTNMSANNQNLNHFQEPEYINPSSFKIEDDIKMQPDINNLQDEISQNDSSLNIAPQESTIHKVAPEEEVKKSIPKPVNAEFETTHPEHITEKQKDETNSLKQNAAQIEQEQNKATLKQENENNNNNNNNNIDNNVQKNMPEKTTEENEIESYEIRTNAPYTPISV